MRLLMPIVLAALISTAFVAYAAPLQLPAPTRTIVSISNAKATVLGSGTRLRISAVELCNLATTRE